MAMLPLAPFVGYSRLRSITAHLVGMAVTSSLVAAFRKCYGPLAEGPCICSSCKQLQ